MKNKTLLPYIHGKGGTAEKLAKRYLYNIIQKGYYL